MYAVCALQRPDVWARIREEQAQVVAQHGPVLSKAALDSSKYLDAVVREALRLNSPGTMQARCVHGTRHFLLPAALLRLAQAGAGLGLLGEIIIY